MSNSIWLAIVHSGGNSLSPEPCALNPSYQDQTSYLTVGAALRAIGFGAIA